MIDLDKLEAALDNFEAHYEICPQYVDIIIDAATNYFLKESVSAIQERLAAQRQGGDIKEALDWLDNTTWANAYGDNRDGSKMLEIIRAALSAQGGCDAQ